LKFEDFSWELGKPSKTNSGDCLPCIFLQFVVIETGVRVSKIMQIFSKQVLKNLLIFKYTVEYLCSTKAYFKFEQADMMDALISTFVAQRKKQGCSNLPDEVDGPKVADHPGTDFNFENYIVEFWQILI
jgi:hypothetical protein